MCGFGLATILIAHGIWQPPRQAEPRSASGIAHNVGQVLSLQPAAAADVDAPPFAPSSHPVRAGWGKDEQVIAPVAATD
jgi:hypothetical protein